MKRDLRRASFILVQLLVLPTALGLMTHSYQNRSGNAELPEFRIEPLQIVPQYDDPRVVSDAQLRMVLGKLKPRFRGPHPRINFVDHALRMWGADAVFEDPECLSGEEMRALLLDHRIFSDAWGPETQPFLVPDTRGVAVTTQEGAASASHVDHTLAGLAEVGTPLDYPVITPEGEVRLRAVLEHAFRQFSLNQQEYEWSTLAFALYLPPVQRWYSTEGQQITFDRLADRIMRQRLADGVCRGQHRLHALVMLLRVDEQEPILSTGGRERIIAYLQDVTQRFVASQRADGYWDRTWPGVEWDGPQPEIDDAFAPRVDRILVTGHVLEWWALAPEEILPPRQVIVTAAQWLCAEIETLTAADIRRDFTFLSHAGRALALWRGTTPAAAWRRLTAL